MDAQLVIYTSVPLSYINVTTNMNLQTILQNINTAVNSSSAAPNYSGYNLYCVTQTDGSSHPTNTQNFAEGISKILCDLKTAYTTFTGTTYVTNQSVLTTAITGLQVPGITYSPFSITNTDTITQVLNKNFTGIGTILTAINPNAANWSTLSLSTQTTITGGFNALISYLSTLTTTVSGKQAQIGTFNNSSNYLSGTSTDSIFTTMGLMITYVGTLPTFATGGLTWGCVTSSSTLTGTVQNILSSVTSIQNNYVAGIGTGLSIATISSCSGKAISIDTTWSGLYKVAVSSGDVASAGYLGAKITSLDGSITIDTTTHSDKVDLKVASPVTNLVKVNNSDPTAGYLTDKIQSQSGNWGMYISALPSVDNTKLNLVPMVGDPVQFVTNLMSYISSNPELLGLFCSLSAQCNGNSCSAPTALTVAISGTSFILTWTPSGTALTQQSKYRQRGNTSWITNINITPANPETNVLTTSTIASLGANTAYQFQVDSICASGNNGSNVYESIIFSCQTITTNVTARVLSATQNPLSTVDTIQYRLKASDNVTVLQNVTTTGLSPNVTFASVGAGTYYIEWRYGTLINGVTLYSTDASQLNAWCTHSAIVIS